MSKYIKNPIVISGIFLFFSIIFIFIFFGKISRDSLVEQVQHRQQVSVRMGSRLVENLVNSIGRSIIMISNDPTQDELDLFVSNWQNSGIVGITHLDRNGVVTQSSNILNLPDLGQDLSDRDYSLSPKDTAKPGDTVLSMSGTIGMSAVIPADVPKCSINQRILRFSSKNIDNNYLVLVLNSIVGFYQLERIGTGGVQTNISYRDIQNIFIPVLPKATQEKIAELVRKSHEARKKSKQLLEEAKRKVEEMIENLPLTEIV